MSNEPAGQEADARGPELSVTDYTPRTAFLEFGSTSIKFYIVGLAGAGAGKVEREIKFAWDLGYDVFLHSRISPRTITRCVETLRKIRADFPDIALEGCTAVGTAALREAQNTEVFQRVLWEELRIRAHIIEGGIEAFLLETGFRDSILEFPTGLFDLGGGSLELVEYLTPHSTKKTSLPVGAIRLHCQLRSTRDLFSYVIEGRRIVQDALRTHLEGQTPPYRSLIGTGGTVRALVDIVGRNEFDAADLRQILARELHGPAWDSLPPHRRKVLLPGILAIEGLFVVLKLDQVLYRTASVKRGLMTLMSLIPAGGAGEAKPS